MKRFLSSLTPAIHGIKNAWLGRNFKIQIFAAFLVIIFGLLFQISLTEWCIILILCALVLGLEIINTSIERLCDLISIEYNPIIKEIKDLAAGAVLIVSVISVIIGFLIFLPKIIIFI